MLEIIIGIITITVKITIIAHSHNRHQLQLQWMGRLHEAQETHREWLKGGRETSEERSFGEELWNKKKKERSGAAFMLANN